MVKQSVYVDRHGCVHFQLHSESRKGIFSTKTWIYPRKGMVLTAI
jgi:hypothetical protein